jgi:uncharacterized membrane-anchored protein
MQEQNKCLQAGMNRRSYLQLSMKETVGGLSVAVISYYQVGLIAYVGTPIKLCIYHFFQVFVLSP